MLSLPFGITVVAGYRIAWWRSSCRSPVVSTGKKPMLNWDRREGGWPPTESKYEASIKILQMHSFFFFRCLNIATQRAWSLLRSFFSIHGLLFEKIHSKFGLSGRKSGTIWHVSVDWKGITRDASGTVAHELVHCHRFLHASWRNFGPLASEKACLKKQQKPRRFGECQGGQVEISYCFWILV